MVLFLPTAFFMFSWVDPLLASLKNFNSISQLYFQIKKKLYTFIFISSVHHDIEDNKEIAVRRMDGGNRFKVSFDENLAASRGT